MKNYLPIRCGLILILVLTTTIFLSCADDESNQIQQEERQIVEVQRSDLFISVMADGSLIMPRRADLRFGTDGTVKEVLVQEGDIVKAGTLLAKLDDTSQKVSLESAEYDLQIALNNLVLTIPGCQQLIGYPRRYPNKYALLLFEQAQTEVEEVQKLLIQNNYKKALSELRIALHDLGSSLELHQAPMRDIETYPDIARSVAEAEKNQDALYYVKSYPVIFEAIELMQLDRQNLMNVQARMQRAENTEALAELKKAHNEMEKTHRVVARANGMIQKRTLSFPDVSTSLDFMESVQDQLINIQSLLEQGDIDSFEFIEQVRMAYHDLETSSTILESSELVAENGLSLKTAQDYTLDLKTSIANMRSYLDDLEKTEILAPFDGTVVSIGVKEDDQLSTRDYSSKTAVRLVDTNAVYFEGVVDEIDILQVKAGQQATITIDALPNQSFTGIVSFIAPSSTRDPNIVNYTVTIQLDTSEIEFKGGLTATAEISIASRENVLLIPTQAILKTPEGNFTEVVIDEETMTTEKRQIVVGLKSYQFAELISGVQEGEKVIVIEQAAPEEESGRPRGFMYLRR